MIIPKDICNLDAEKGILAILLNEESSLKRISELPNSLFIDERNMCLLEAIQDVSRKGETVNDVTVSQYLKRSEVRKHRVGSIKYPFDVSGHFTSKFNFDYWLNILREYSKRRQVFELGKRAQELASDTAVDPTKLPEEFNFICKSLLRQAGPQKERFRFYSPRECRSYEPPEGHVLVGDCHIVRGSITVLSGAPGTGKSRAATYLALAGAMGSDWFGLKVHAKFKTAILQAENGRYRLKTELSGITDDSLDDYIRISEPPPSGMAFRDIGFRDALRDYLDDFNPGVLVLDPWNGITGDDSQKDYRAALDNIREAVPKGNKEPAILIVAHNRKPKSDERKTGRSLLNEVAGSHVIGSAARCVFIIEAASDDGEDNRIVLSCAKNNDGNLPPQSAWYRENGIFLPCPNFDMEEFHKAASSKPVPISIEHMRKLFESGQTTLEKGRAVNELMEITGKGKSSCYKALDVNAGKFSEYLEEIGGLIEWREN